MIQIKEVIKKMLPVTVAFLMCIGVAGFLAGCETSGKAVVNPELENTQAVRIVTTSFPAFDFARQIAGDKAMVTQLLPLGAESHTYEPTPKDMVMIQNADIFIYGGGESDSWLDTILDSVGTENTVTLAMMDCVQVLNEELVEGMQEEGEEEGEEPDEHVWTSPYNAVLICQAIEKALCAADPANKDYYADNCTEYVAELNEIAENFTKHLDECENRVIVVADRFPFRYFTDAFGIEYYAAFPGCSEDAEVTPATLAFLCDVIKSENITTAFYVDFSSGKIADSICETVGCGKAQLFSCHNVTAEQYNSGETYISLMQRNCDAIIEALGR